MSRIFIIVFFFSTQLLHNYPVLSEKSLHSYNNKIAEDNTLSESIMLSQTEQFPLDKQLYARNIQTNMAQVSITGQIVYGHYQSVELQVFREAQRVDVQQQVLTFSGGLADYSFNYDLLAERSNYTFELYGIDQGAYNMIKRAVDVVAGDVYMICGQSNAEAKGSSGSSVNYNDSFVRVYGKSLSYGPNDWFIARGDVGRGGDGNTGQWGLVFANLISNQEGIPIAIFNGAHGGTMIDFHQRNDDDPTDVTTNYGRMLTRLELTGLSESVRGLLWYQGESNYNSTQNYYENLFDALYKDWKIDYPNIEQFYTMQVRTGCKRGPFQLISIQEAQRAQARKKADMKLLTTKGISTDGCHYNFEGGYEELGKRIADLILNDLYQSVIPDTDAPDIMTAYVVENNPSQIRLILSGANAINIDPNAYREFQIVDNTILSATAEGNNVVLLQLAIPLNSPAKLTYYDSSPMTTTDYISNSRGIGLASFKNFPVVFCSDFNFQDGDNDNICDADDLCPNFDNSMIGEPCDDNDICTTNDVFTSDCDCLGIFQDMNGDGVCDAVDGGCVQMNYEDFETSAGIWQSNGIDAAYVQSSNSPEGSYSFEIRDNSGAASSFSSDVLDLSGDIQTILSFAFKTKSLSNGEDFFFEVSNDGGVSFVEERQWIKGVDFENDIVYQDDVYVTGSQTSETTVFRFRCDGSINADAVYIDNINIDTCTATNGNNCLLVNLEDFETSSGIWQSNGIDAAYVQSADSPSGNYSFRIRDNSGVQSSFSSSILDLSGETETRVSFRFKAKSLVDGEEFFLEISTDGGNTFVQEQQWVKGADFENNIVYQETILLDKTKTSSTTVFRYRCNGSINADEVYIDDIEINSCPLPCAPFFSQTDNSRVENSVTVAYDIESNGIIQPNADIQFSAGESVLLIEGFELQMGAVFHALIEACGN